MKGKIVLCDQYTSGVSEAYKVGALGSILTNYINIDDASFVLPLPASTLNNTEFNEVMSYMNSTRYRFFRILIRHLSHDDYSH